MKIKKAFTIKATFLSSPIKKTGAIRHQFKEKTHSTLICGRTDIEIEIIPISLQELDLEIAKALVILYAFHFKKAKYEKSLSIIAPELRWGKFFSLLFALQINPNGDACELINVSKLIVEVLFIGFDHQIRIIDK